MTWNVLCDLDCTGGLYCTCGAVADPNVIVAVPDAAAVVETLLGAAGRRLVLRRYLPLVLPAPVPQRHKAGLAAWRTIPLPLP